MDKYDGIHGDLNAGIRKSFSFGIIYFLGGIHWMYFRRILIWHGR